MKLNVLMYKTLPLIKVKLFGTIKAEEYDSKVRKAH
jgi:hypothetical protein